MNNLPKQFVLQLGSLVTLYVSITAFITLIFSTINLALPDDAAGYWSIASDQSTLRLSLAILFVFYPTYLFLTRTVHQGQRTANNAYLTIAKWLIYLSLLVAGIVMLIDLVVILNTFLSGEITARFITKALALLVVIGTVFYYYILDARGYWTQRPQHSLMYAAVATAIVVGGMAASLYQIDTPSEVRNVRLDEQQINDLQDMQWRIEAYYQEQHTLPASVDELYISETMPVAPSDRTPYEYKITDSTSYELCATFTSPTSIADARSMAYPAKDAANYNWDHKAGEWCFARTVPTTDGAVLID